MLMRVLFFIQLFIALYMQGVAQTNCGYVVNLPDTIKRCAAANVQVNPIVSTAKVPFDTFWTPIVGLSNPNLINPIVGTGAVPGYYYLHVLAESGNNMVVNGDFSAGNTGFTSGYTGYITPPGGMIPERSYMVTANTLTAHTLSFPMPDHTTGTGMMMVINGSGTPNVTAWCQTVSVQPNTTYNFTAWTARFSNANAPVLQVAVNGVNLGNPVTMGPSMGIWETIGGIWNSGSFTTAVICITDLNTALSGNDFTLDDISLRTVCEILDSVFVQNLNPTQSTQSASLCAGNSFSFGGSTLTASGTYMHTFTGINGCDSVVTLNLNFQNTVSSTQQIRLCPGTTYSFGGQSLNTGGVYTHTFSTTGGCDSTVTLTLSYLNPTGDTVSINTCRDTSFMFGNLFVDTSGTYRQVFVNSQGCDSLVTLFFAENEVPLVSFFYTPAEKAVNVPVSFTNTSQNAIRYGWTFGDNTSSDDANPTHQHLRTGIYTVCLTGWNSGGCIATTCQQVEAEARIGIEVPTAFSPNGDGKNDVLWVRGNGIETLYFVVYNRWGQKVFEANDVSQGWDGNHKGTPVEAEALAYMLTATFIDGSTISRQGNLTIVR